MPHALQFLVFTLAGWLNRHQEDLIDYLREENRVLREQLGGQPLRLTDAQRRRLAARGERLGRRALTQVASIVTPDTILRWYRRLIAKKYDGRVLSSWAPGWQTLAMDTSPPSYRGHRFPAEIISHAVWLYHRFCLSFRDVEDLLAERGITVSHETVRQWCRKFGTEYARRLKQREGRLGDTWHLDELFVNIQGQRQYLWRAVDQDGDVIDILVQSRRNRHAAKRFFRKLLKGQGSAPRRLITDKLGSYGAARRAVMPSVVHDTRRYANNRAEVSHQPARQRERQMRRFKSAGQAQRFISVQGVVLNLFRVGRHLLRPADHRLLRERAFGVWSQVTCA